MYVLHYAPDNASMIVRLVLEDAGIDHRLALVDRSAQAQHSAAYRALNPAGRIPVLETPDGPLAETGAILLWLTDRHGLGPAPGDPRRAAFLQWLFFLSNTAHADLLRVFYADRYTPEGHEARFIERAIQQMGRNFRLLEEAALRHPWMFAPPMPVAIYTAALCRWSQLYPTLQARWYRPGDFPALSELCAVLDTLPATARVARHEGLGPHPFSAPVHPTPPEGSVL